MSIEHLSDPDDPRLDAYRIVRDPELVKRSHLFLAEGRQLVRVLMASGRWSIESFVMTPTTLDVMRDDLATHAPDTPCFVLSRADIRALGNIDFHQGCLAAAQRPPIQTAADFQQRHDGRLWIGFDAVGNPDNVGAIFRSARALGASAAVLSGTSCSPLYRKAIRASMGASLLLPFLHADAPWDEILDELRAAGRLVWALSPDGDTEIEDALRDAPDDARHLLLVGAEGPGLGAASRARADRHVRIRMRADVDSLNVASATALALYLFDRRFS